MSNKKLLPVETIELTITKASIAQGEKRWACVASDTGKDKAEEQTSLALFQDWIDRIQTGKSVSFLPPPRWPFLGLSHYPDLDGKGEGGITTKVYTDGNRFKAAGTFKDNPLGEALSSAIIQERALIKKGEFDGNPIRISAGWYDLSHQHTEHDNYIFVRQSLIEKCPVCEAHGPAAQADKVYLAGQLDHFACTRVPMNTRTSVTAAEVNKSMAKKPTRKEDAQSIVPDELAEELDLEATAIGKSDTGEESELPEAMVTRSDEEESESESEVQPEPDTEKARGKRKRKEPPAFSADDTEDEEELTEEDMEEMKKGEGKKKHKKYMNDMPVKADTDESDEESDDLEPEEDLEPDTEKMYPGRPLGGATSMKDAINYITSKDKLDKVYSRFAVFQAVCANIKGDMEMDASDKVKAMTNAVNELAGEISVVKAAIEDGFLADDIEVQSDYDEEDYDYDDNEESADAQKSVYEQLYEENPTPQTEVEIMDPQAENGFDARAQAIKSDTSLNPEQKREAYQELLNEQALAFKADVDQEQNKLDPGGQIGALTNAIAKLAESQAKLQADLALIAQKSAAPVESPAIPTQKSMVAQPPVQQAQPPVQHNGVAIPDSLRQFVNKSVGL